MKYYFICQSGLGRRWIIEKKYRTPDDMRALMALYPGCELYEVDEATYNYMSIADAW